MDTTAEQLLKVLQGLEREQWRLTRKIAALRTALSLAGVPLPPHPASDANEERYARDHLFAGKRLIDCCERVVKDYHGQWIGKRQVAYLLERGGYSSKGNLVNSVECTLRRLASLGRIEVNRSRGRDGNQYRFAPASWAPKPGPKPQGVED